MPEKIKNMYGIIDEKLLDYEDICNTYSELLEHEINKEQLNIKNIKEIALSFAYIFKVIYPEYENIEIDIMEVYREKKDKEKISIISAYALLNIDDKEKNYNGIKLIKLIEENLTRDYYARNKALKVLKKLN